MTITVYTKPDCVQCHALYVGLFTRGIVDIDIVNLATEPAAMEKVKGIGYQQAPVLTTESIHFSGNDVNKLDELALELESRGAVLTRLTFQEANERAMAIKKELKAELEQALAA